MNNNGSSSICGGGGGGGNGNGPCGACKFLRRKCVRGCVFAPYFDSEQGAAHFAAVHKIFGASNVSKLLLRIPVHKRLDAVVTICYEALARVHDPVYGCVSHIFALQQQVVNLQAELAFVQAHLSTLGLSSVSQAIQPIDQSPAMPNTNNNGSSSSNMFSTTTCDVSTHFGPSQSPPPQQQQVVLDTGGCCSPAEPPLDDEDLHAIAREFFLKYVPAAYKFQPPDS